MRVVSEMMSEFRSRATKPPEPKTIALRKAIDLRLLECFGPKYADEVRRFMVHELAQHLLDKCEVFQVPSYADLLRDPIVCMELTINDRGSYENWLPIERDTGRAEGRKRTLQDLPYGTNPTEFYE